MVKAWCPGGCGWLLPNLWDRQGRAESGHGAALGFPAWGEQVPPPPGSTGLSLQRGGNRRNRGNGTFLGSRDAQIFPVSPASPARACHSHKTRLHSVVMVLGAARSAKGSRVAELCTLVRAMSDPSCSREDF